MIRIETKTGWILVDHQDHAVLAGQFADHWGNAQFAAPEPRAEILAAVYQHDDAWALRDQAPRVTRDGLPSAFSRELVGKYSAFEEIDLEDYLAVRARAAAGVAATNPYAAIVISLHTVDLLTTRADWLTLTPANRSLLTEFVAAQRDLQSQLIARLAAGDAASSVAPPVLQRAFEFLQACDSLSLTACVRFPTPIPLRHRHPTRTGDEVLLLCTPLGGDRYRLSPYPFDQDELVLSASCRSVVGRTFPDDASFRAAFRSAPCERLTVRVVR